ncbi:ABC transporter permease [Terriglobus roseus]|uniref:Duplicated orphan permease n=1 Tax=Terriglobus roseus TaxID=392734 RepID=A0A1H4KND9_9BACT|nr:ABC transporter permease [Terriglobus roseus]SEB59615.1 duplicated orphan permease [Terriglobus roseus]
MSPRLLLARLLAFFQKARLDAELEGEIAVHLDMAIEDNLRLGLSPQEARRQALIRFGGTQQIREEHRGVRGLPWLDVLLQDLRYGFRTLRRDTSFSIIAVLILALGIGANIVVFSVVNTILLRPLPFPQADRLVRITPKASKCGASCATYSTDAVQEFQTRNKSFADVTGYDAFTSPGNWKLTASGSPLPVTEIDVMDNFFRTLGVQPQMGRLTFTAEESRPGGPPVAILSHAFWQRQLNGDRNIVGQAISFGNTPTTIIGVLPETFDFGAIYSPGSTMDIFTPYVYDRVREYGNMLSLMGRLKPGVSIAQAQSEASMLFPDLDGSVKRGWKGHYTAELTDLKEFVAGSLRRSLVVLWCAVGLILLIACVNLSNLLFARAAARSREFALRSALGAARGRIVRQLVTESLLLSAAGAILGMGIALAAVLYLAHQGSIALPLLTSVRIDKTAIAWTILIAVIAGLLLGVGPGLRISSGNLQQVMKESANSTTGSKGTELLRTALVISQIALACILLVAAGLLLRSFLRVLDVDLGFQPAHSSAIALDYEDRGDAARRAVFDREVLRQIKAIPGVQTAAITDSLPMSRNRSWGISAKGKHYEPDELPGTFVYVVSPGYLQAIGMRLTKGRDISWDDVDPKQAVVIVNETVARYLWPNEDPIDRIALVGGSEARVIGVIADVRETAAESKAGWQMYVSAAAPQFGPSDSQLILRSTLPVETLQPAVLGTLRRINPGQPTADLRPIQLLVDRASSPRRFFVYLVAIFAALGLVLAALGIYGVISYSVTQRTQEIGIRMALGATRRDVQMGIVSKTLRLAALGIAIGIVASLAISSFIASLLFGTTPTDPATFTTICLLLAGVALAAGYIPARRASRIDPMVALRNT